MKYFFEYSEEQKKHLEEVAKFLGNRWVEDVKDIPCVHMSCPSCLGTGIKKDGTMCVHMISCKCKRCTPYY